MATVLSVQDFRGYLEGQTTRGIIAPTLVAADVGNGHEFLNQDRTYLWVENTSGAVRTLTFLVSPCSFGETHAFSATVNNGDKGLIGPFNPHRFHTSSNGRVTVAYSGGGLSVAAVRL